MQIRKLELIKNHIIGLKNIILITRNIKKNFYVFSSK